jgi:hypothetical protein
MRRTGGSHSAARFKRAGTSDWFVGEQGRGPVGSGEARRDEFDPQEGGLR